MKFFRNNIIRIALCVLLGISVLGVSLYLLLNFDVLAINYFSTPSSIKARFEQALITVKKEENRIEIPVIGVAAKVSYPEKDQQIDALLAESVVHLPQTAMPGGKNNVVITGHSSSLTKGVYRNIFASLYRLKNGDEIDLYYKKAKFVYQVSTSKVVAVSDSSVLSSDKAGLTLITCWPLGTDWQRLVVTARLVR